MERWLLPAMIVVFGMLLAGLGLLLLRWLRARRNADDLPGRTILRLFAAAALALPLGHQASLVAFHYLFSMADNHDTALPWLLAALVGLAVFLVVASFAFAVIALLLGWLLPRPW